MLQWLLLYAYITTITSCPSQSTTAENHGWYIPPLLSPWQLKALPNPTSDNKPEDNNSPEINPTLQLMRLALTQAVPQALKVFVELGIPDILLDSDREGLAVSALIPRIVSVPTTSSILQDGGRVVLVLRILSTVGIVEEIHNHQQQPTFRLTFMGSLLSTSHENSANSMVRYFLDEPIWRAWGSLSSYVTAGDNSMSSFEMANQVPSHQYYGMSEHKESLKYANNFVRYIARQKVRACVESFDWDELSGKTVVDLGGHTGQLMKSVAAKYPLVTCLCLDVPEIVQSVVLGRPNGTTGNGSISSVVEFVAGNMFDPTTIPPCDAIFMKHILLCDWDEEKSLAILESCYKVLPLHGLITVGESILPNHGSTDGSISLYVDLFMMLDGRSPSRTLEEWETFVKRAGFQVRGIQHSCNPTCSILVLQKVVNSDSTTINKIV